MITTLEVTRPTPLRRSRLSYSAANSSTLNSSVTGNSIYNITDSNNDSNTAIASYNGLVKAGQTFVLYFPVYVEPSAEVGKLYHGLLRLHFFTLEQERKIKSEFNTASKSRAFDLSRQINASATIQILKSLDKLNARDKSNLKTTNRVTPFESTSRTIDIPFRISGKVILLRSRTRIAIIERNWKSNIVAIGEPVERVVSKSWLSDEGNTNY